MSPPVHTSRTALAHAVLTAIHPAVASSAHFPFPVPLPSELHLLVRAHLRIHIARALLDALHASLSAALAALCDDCRSYYAHVFGPHVADWPVIRTGRGCRCTAIGLPTPSPSSSKADRADDACLEPPRPPVGDKEPPAYFIAHVQRTLATYAAMDPSFPYADQPMATSADLDTLVSRVLSTFGWTALPATSHRDWEFDDDVMIAPLSASSASSVPPIALDGLQIHLDLAMHGDLLARSPLHPTKVTYFPPLPPPTTTVTRYAFSPLSTSLASGLLLLALASPLAFTYALHVSAN